MINYNAIPIKEKFYIREEGEIFRIIPTLGYGAMKMINETTKIFLEQIDGNHTLFDIFNTITNMYSDIDAKQVIEDFEKAVIDLYGAKIISFKLIKGEILNMYKEIIYKNTELNMEIVHFTELDLHTIMSFFSIKSNKVILNDSISGQYNELTIRNQLFSYGEEFYGLFKNNNIQSIVSFKQKYTEYGNYYRNGIFVFNEEIDNYQLKLFLGEVSCHLLNSEFYNCKRIRINFLEKETCEVGKVLQQIGYTSIIKEGQYLIGEYTEFIFDFIG